jgi:hypothetical protein
MFYVYILAQPSGKPFYVGKGTQRKDGSVSRPSDHAREARSGHKCHKCSVIRKIWRTGGKVQVYTVLMTDNEQEAYTHEQALIELYGLENLTNQTVGGEGGACGVVFSEERRAKMSAIARELAQDPEWRRKVSERTKAAFDANPEIRKQLVTKLKERHQDPAYKEKHRAAVRRGCANPAARHRKSEAGKRRFSDPAERQRQLDRLRIACEAPEAQQKKAASIERSWRDPDVRQRRIEGQKRVFATEGSKQRRSAASRKRYESPEQREQTRQANLVRYQNPDERRKTIEANIRRYGYTYTLCSPDGQTFTTNNLNEFCKEHGLNSSHMRRTVIGELKHHKGWTGERHKPADT